MRNSVQAMLIISSSDSTGDEPGLWSVAMAIGTRRRRAALHRRQPGFAQEVVGAGQQHGHGAGGAHRRDAVGRQVFQVVARQRAEPRRQCRAVLVAQLLGMQLDRQAQAARGVEHAFGLFGAEGDVVAEHVDGVDQAGLQLAGSQPISASM
jgi:hypothetical protein